MSQSTRLATPRPATTTTQVETASDAQPSIDSAQGRQITGTLRLRGHRTEHETRNNASEERRIRWAEDVVDNEGQGRKSSKVCCIYHRPRAVGESSSESESSSDSSSDDSDSDSDVDNGQARMGNRLRRHTPRQHYSHHDHDHDHCQPDNDDGSQQPGPTTRKKRSRPKPNAYERMPRYSKKPQN